MFGNRFYNELTRKYITVFGTLFNDIVIDRKDNSDQTIQSMKVPIHNAPIQKLLARVEGDPNLDAPAITLPRMSFEMKTMEFDNARKAATGNINRYGSAVSDANSRRYLNTPAPYNLEFELNVVTKYYEDGLKILEQILPYFRPDVTLSMQLLDDVSEYTDVPVILNSLTMEDTYENSFQDRRAIIWTLTFTMKAHYYGPTSNRKIIKFVDINFYESTDTDAPAREQVQVMPGMTANNEPTTIEANSIDRNLIEFDDNWGYIVQFEDDDG